jgi:hypothetical protein
MASEKVEIEFVVLDKAGNVVSKINKKTEEWGKTTKNAGDSMKKSLSDLRVQLKRYQEASEKSYNPAHIERYSRMIAQTKSQISALERQTKSCTDKTAGLAGTITKLGLGAMAINKVREGFSAAGDFTKESVQADAQMQKYNAGLKTMLGSTTAARDRMSEYMNIAKKTPFELSEVVEAGNQLQATGRYSRDTLEMLGDLAAASGKPMEQAVNAYNKLATGQKGEGARMFQDLLISYKDFEKATGKGRSKSGELLASTEQMIAALPKIMKSKGFLGMMATQAETTAGKIANLDDNIFQLKSSIGERLRPTTNSWLELESKVVDKLNEAVAIPIEQKIAAEKLEVNRLMNALIENYPHEEKRKELFDELNRKYPEILKNIDREKTSQEELRGVLANVNAEYATKIRNAAIERIREKMGNELLDAETTVLKHETAQHAKVEMYKFDKGIEDKYGYGSFVRDYLGGNELYIKKKGGGYIIREAKNDPEVAAMVAERAALREVAESTPILGSYQGAKRKRDQYLAQISAYDKLYGANSGSTTTGGAAAGATTAAGGTTTTTTPPGSTLGTNDSSGNSTSRAQTTNIHIANMIGTWNAAAGYTESRNDVEDKLAESLARILGMAETAA